MASLCHNQRVTAASAQRHPNSRRCQRAQRRLIARRRPRARQRSTGSRGRCACALAVVLAAVVALPAVARSQPLFGKNKVVYADREWKVYQEDMIQVYFYPDEEELARRVFAWSMQAYAEYSTYFDFVFEQPIPIILYGTHHDFKQTHVIPGFIPDFTLGFTEFAKGRVALPATGSYAQLHHVLRHELVHAFMLSKLAKVMNSKEIFDYNGPPLWFVEGLAENVSRGSPDVQAEMFLRDALIHQYLVPIPDLWQIAGSFLMYKEGESILGYLRVQYGDRVPAMLLEQWWRGRNFAEVLQAELGLSAQQLSDAWINYLRRRYFPQMLTRRSPDETGRALTDKPTLETSPKVIRVREDGTIDLACLSARDGTISLYNLRIPRHGKPSFHRLIEGGRTARFESLPAFGSRLDSHDGRYLAFVSKNGGADALYVYDLEKGGVVRELSWPELRQIASPSFSPDGSRIVFSGLSVHGQSDLYVTDVVGGGLVALTSDPYHDIHPDWHPTDDRIVFASDRGDFTGGSHSLYVVSPDDPGKLTRLTPPGGNDNEPVWSPQGDAVLYSSDRSGTYNLHVWREGMTRQVTNVIGGLYNPSWIPAERGDAVVATCYHKGRFQLYTFDMGQQGLAEPVVARAEPSTSRAAADVPSPALAKDPVAQNYKVRLGLDFVQSAVALDPDVPFNSGANLAFTDLLGDHQVFAHISSASDELNLDDLNLGVSYSNLARRWNLHAGAFRLNTLQRLTSLRPERIERRTGGFFGVTYPFSTFNRVEMTTVFRYLERDGSLQLPGEPGESWLWSGFVSYVHDNTLWTFQGPMRGTRWYVTLGQTFDLRGRGFDRQTVQADYRKYFQIFRNTVFATRAIQRWSFGSDTQFFYLGGANDLRGYPTFAFFGDRVTLFNAELRFPLIDRIALGFPFGRFDFPSLRGGLFFDAGNVGGPIFDTGWIGSFGASVAMTLFPPVVFRVDFVRPTDFEEVGDLDVDFNLSLLY